MVLALAWMLLVTTPVGAVSPQDQDQAQDQAQDQTQPLTVSFCIDCVPFEFQDESGAPAGMIIDMWRLFSEKTGIPLDFIAFPWGQTLDLVGSGAADVHAGLFYTEDRDHYLDYGPPLFQSDTHLFFHESVTPTTDLESLTAFRIGVIKGDITASHLKMQIPDAILSEYSGYDALIADLKRGTIRVFAADTPTALYYLDQAGLQGRFVHLTQSPLYQSDWFVAARNGDQSTLELVSQGMAQITDRERSQIARRWTSGSIQQVTDDTLIIAMDRANAPYTFLTPVGRPAGLLVDIWTAWAEKTGRSIRFLPLTGTRQILDSLHGGTADLAAGLAVTRTGAWDLAASSQIYRQSMRLFRRTDAPAGQGDRRIGMVADPLREATVRRLFSAALFTTYPTASNLIDAVVTGEVDAALHDDRAMEAVVRELGLQGLIAPSPRRLLAAPIVAGVLPERTALLEDINVGLAKLSAADLSAIQERWVEDPEAQFFGRGLRDADIGLTAEDRVWLTEHPTLRLGVDRAWAPYEYLDEEGTHRGLSAAFTRRIEEILGISFLPPPDLPWTEVISRAEAGRLDVLPAVAPAPDRLDRFVFTAPYMVWPTVIATRNDRFRPQSLADLAGNRLGVVEGYALQSLLSRDHPEVTLVPLPDLPAALTELERGRIDAVMDSPAALLGVATELEIGPLALSPPTPYTLDLTIGVRKDWPELARILDKALNQIPAVERQRLARNAGLSDTLPLSQITGNGEREELLSTREIALLSAAAICALAFILIFARGLRRQQRPMLQSLNAKSILFLMGAFLVVGAATLWGFNLIGQQVLGHLGENIAQRQVLWHRERVIGAIEREIALTTQMAESQILKRWAADDANPIYRIEARQELQAFHDNFASRTVFAVFAKSLKYYYADDSVDRISLEPVDTLSRDDPNDSWFFDTLTDEVPYKLNVDHSTALGVTNLWINHVMRSGGRPLGAIGTGVPLTEFVEEFINQDAEGVETLMMNAGGTIQTEVVGDEWNTAGPTPDSGPAALAAIWDRLGGAADRDTLRQQMYALKQNGDTASTFFLNMNGGDRLVAMTYLAPLDWYSLAIFDPGSFIGAEEKGALAAVFVVGLLITGIAFALGQNLLIVRPLLGLTEGARRLSDGDFTVRLETNQHDEIGDLTRSFNDMAATIDTSTQELKGKLAEIERFNRLATGRESRIVELKEQVNQLCREAGRPVPFALAAEADPDEDADQTKADGPTDQAPAIEDLLDVPMLSRLLTSFCESVGVAAAIVDLDGRVLAAARWQRACTDFHRVNKATCALCIESDTELGSSLEQGKAFTVYRCRNGLTDAASPLIVEDRHLANVFIGQFLLEAPDTAFFAAQARRRGFNEKDYLKAIAEVPVITEDRLPAILDFLTGFARMVAAQSMVSVRAETARQDLQRGRLAAMSLAEDAEAARAEVAAYKDQLEDLVKERTLKLQSIIDTAVDGIIVIDEAGLIQSFSPAASAIFGYEAEEVIGRNVSILGPQGHGAKHDANLLAHKNGKPSPVVGRTQEVTARRKDGSLFRMDLAIGEAWLDDQRFFTGITRDITARKEAEDRLAQAEEQNRLILGSVADGIFGTDTDGRLIFINDRACALLGHDREALVGRSLHDLAHHSHPDGTSYPVEDCPMWAAFSHGTSALVDDEVLWRRDGTSFPVEYSAAPMFRDGTIIGAVIAFRDITDRKEAERLIQQSEQKIRRIFETAKEGIWMLDLNYHVNEVNATICAMLDRPEGEVRGHSLFDFVHPDDHDRLATQLAETGQARDDLYEFALVRPDGSLVHCLCNASPLLDEEQRTVGSFGMLTDITARKHAEEALTDAYEVIAGSIEYASRIQRSMLPDAALLDALVPDHFVIWEPRDRVGGDAYWCHRWGRGALLALGDCTGHGVPGAFMTLIANGAMEMALLEVPPGDPAMLLSRVHGLIQSLLGQDSPGGESNDGLDIGICYIPPRGGTIAFAGARISLFRVLGDTVEEVRGDKQGVGYRAVPHAAHFTNQAIEPRPGKILYMTSDGLLDQVGGPRRRGFGKRRFLALLQEIAPLPLAEQRAAIVTALAEHQGDEERRDDVSVIGFKV
jgi:PAS domain S-box-containing protein